MFLSALGLPANVASAKRYTRYNHRALADSTKNKRLYDGKGYWQLGHEVTRINDDVFKWVTWTVDDSTHVKNFTCRIDSEGKLLPGGRVNVFVGWMPIDQEYIDTLLAEVADSQIAWDKIN